MLASRTGRANAQLLELRVYDALLDAELPALYDRIQAARARWNVFFTRFRPLLAGILPAAGAKKREAIVRVFIP